MRLERYQYDHETLFGNDFQIRDILPVRRFRCPITVVHIRYVFLFQLPPGYEDEGLKRKPKINEPTSPVDEKEGPHFAKKPQNHTVIEGMWAIHSIYRKYAGEC